MFKNMKNHEAVKVGDVFFVQLNSNRTYAINDVEIDRKSNVTVPSLDDNPIVKIVLSPSVLTHYEHKKNGEQISQEDYRSRFVDPLKEFLDEDGEYAFPDEESAVLSVRLQHQKQDWRAVYSEREKIKEPVTITLIGEMIDTESDFIETSLSAGRIGWAGRESGLFKVHSGRVALDAVQKVFVANKKKPYESRHSGIKYVKVRGEHVFYDNLSGWVSDVSNVTIFTSLEKAQAHEENIRTTVTGMTHQAFNPQHLEDIVTEMTLDELYQSVRTLNAQLAKVDPKIKTKDAMKKAREQGRKLSRILMRVYKELGKEVMESNSED